MNMADSTLPSISVFNVWKKLQEKICSPASSSRQFDVPVLNKLHDMVYEVYTPPEERPEVEIVLFHDLQLGDDKDAHVVTWLSRDNSCLWVQTWLVELFPKARILTVSYDSSARRTEECGMIDMYCTGENLVLSLVTQGVEVGQGKCPVVLVGHCLGGLVLKETCLSAAWMERRKSATIPGVQQICNFLSNLRGMFFYGTPHNGLLLDQMDNFNGALVEHIKILNVSSARRNQEFDDLKRKHRWITFGIGESCETYVDCLGKHILLAPEASSRQSMDSYYTLKADHYDICKAEGKKAGALLHLADFVHKIHKDRVNHVHVLADAERKQEYVIDVDGRARQVCSMLARTDVHTIFIVGLSGIGKTTLAQQVFHAIGYNFDVTCFVSLDSLEGQSNRSGQVWEKIEEGLKGVYIGSNHNVSSIVSQLKSKRVLLVLDNVESQGQLDGLHTKSWLEGSSSKLIVTSTTSRLGTQSNTFEVNYLSSTESQRLFCHYAFHGGEGPHDLREIIKQVIAKCGNYPLFVKILAGFVSKESDIHERQLWLDLLDRLQKAEEVDGGPDHRLWAKLKMCYNVLMPSEQEMYLDVATMFHGFPFHMVKQYIWKVSREAPHLAWSNLKSRFLVNVDHFGIIQMHAQLRNLGHSIACPRSETVEKWKRISGYSISKELREKLISKDKGIMETLALKLKIMEKDSFKLQKTTFHNYYRLQYLILEGGRTSWGTSWGTMKLPQSLVYLRWKDGGFSVCPVDFAGLEKLVVLELLDCKSMKSLPPSIVRASKLTWLELQGCSALTQLPPGLSKCLQYLSLDSTGLRQLPTDCGNFKELVDLKVSQTKLTRVPQGLGGLEMLSALDLSETGVTTLLESVGDLKRLKDLNLSGTMLISLPDSMGRLQELKKLNFAFTMLGSLPESVGLLQGLKTLNLADSKLHSLPESIGGLQKLTTLYLSATCVKSLPQSVGHLVSLKQLDLQRTPLETLPDSIGNLCNLQFLHLNGSPLESLPDSIGNLCKLEELALEGTQLSTLPDTIGGLALLRVLFLPSLQSVPQTLRELSSVKNCRIDIGALFEAWKSVEARRVDDSAPAAIDGPSQSSIHSFILHALPFRTVEMLTLRGRGYPQSGLRPLFLALQKMPSLEYLNLYDFDLVETIPCELWTLTNLQSLGIDGWERLRGLPKSLGKLRKLEILRVRNNPMLRIFPESASALPCLIGRNCGSLQSMPSPCCHVSSLERKYSTSERDERAPLNFLQPTSPHQLQLEAVCSDSWRVVECFLECCGNHFSDSLYYYVECKEFEKARRMAIRSEIWAYVLDTKFAVELFSELRPHVSGLCNGPQNASPSNSSGQLDARNQILDIRCKSKLCPHWLWSILIKRNSSN